MHFVCFYVVQLNYNVSCKKQINHEEECLIDVRWLVFDIA